LGTLEKESVEKDSVRNAGARRAPARKRGLSGGLRIKNREKESNTALLGKARHNYRRERIKKEVEVSFGVETN